MNNVDSLELELKIVYRIVDKLISKSEKMVEYAEFELKPNMIGTKPDPVAAEKFNYTATILCEIAKELQDECHDKLIHLLNTRDYS